MRNTLTAEGWIYLAIMLFVLGGSLLREINVLVLLFGLLAGLLVFNRYAVWFAVRQVEPSRKLPRRVWAGQELVVEIEVVNHRRIGVWSLAVEDRLEPLAGAAGRTAIQAAAWFPYIPPRSTRQVAYHGRMPARGRYQLGPLRITSRFPLGLVQQWREVRRMAEVVVYPRLGRMLPAWQRLQRGELLGSQPTRRIGAAEGEFHSLRDWRTGDNVRLIHWRTTARQGSLVVRQLERRHGRDLCLILDLPAGPGSRAERMELALRLAATAVVEACRQGEGRLLLGSVYRGQAVLQAAAAGSGPHQENCLDQLAETEPGQPSQTLELFQQGLGQVRRGAVVVVVSTRSPAAAEVPLAAAWQAAGGSAASHLEWLDLSDPASWSPFFQPDPGPDAQLPPRG